MATTTQKSLSHLPPSPPITSPTPRCPKYLIEDNISQECKSLMSTLPKDQGWVSSQLYKYQGFWFQSRHLQGVLTCQRHFQARDTDIILSTSPKCGTTWLKALSYAVVSRKTHALGDDNHPLLSYNPHDVVPFLELKLYVDHQVPDLTNLPSPRLFATHLPVQLLPVSIVETGCKVVYMARDPKDAFISLWHFANKIRPHSNGKLSLEDAFDKFCKGVSIYGPFWDNVLSYYKYSLENPHNKVLFLKYEDLKEQPKLHLMKLAEFLGCPFSLEEENKGVVEEILKLCSFDNMSNLEVNKNGKLSSGEEKKAFFRKGEVGDWANYLTPEMIKKFDEISLEKFQFCGLKF